MQSGVQICGVWCEMCNVVFPLANKLLEKSAKFWPKYKILLFVRGLLWGVECERRGGVVVCEQVGVKNFVWFLL